MARKRNIRCEAKCVKSGRYKAGKRCSRLAKRSRYDSLGNPINVCGAHYKVKQEYLVKVAEVSVYHSKPLYPLPKTARM